MQRGRSLESKGSSLESSQRAKRVSIRSRISSTSASDFPATIDDAFEAEDDGSAIFVRSQVFFFFGFFLLFVVLCAGLLGRRLYMVRGLAIKTGLGFVFWTKTESLHLEVSPWAFPPETPTCTRRNMRFDLKTKKKKYEGIIKKSNRSYSAHSL